VRKYEKLDLLPFSNRNLPSWCAGWSGDGERRCGGI